MVRIGSLAALSPFSRNTNENFLEFLGNIVILTQISGYQILQKCNSDHFKLLQSNYSVMFRDTGLEFTQILKSKLKKIQSADKIHVSYSNGQIPKNVIQAYSTIIENMGDIIEPYLINILEMCFQLYALNPEKSETQMIDLVNIVSEKMSISNSVGKIARLIVFLNKKYMPSVALNKANLLLQTAVDNSET